MLSGFECDEDQSGWLAGLAVWATGAAAGCLLAVATVEPALLHWQVIALSAVVSLVSLGLRLPVMLSQCPGRAWLVHAMWMLAFFAQINWTGFLAARSASGTIAAEAILICLGLEVWLLVIYVSRGQLPWLVQLFNGNAFQPTSDVHNPKGDASADSTSNSSRASSIQEDLQQDNHRVTPHNDHEELGAILREWVDGLDENGQRYLSGSVRLEFESQQRAETFVLSFCPALDGVANVELECDSEDVTAKVDHASETGARITVRRASAGEVTSVTVDWYATALATLQGPLSMNLP